ncbi:hypothetical protein GALMADRAFT_256546 [Galerina marginata CBS 339.88]|uniref:MYND-type domain-containing protein n=1 Tax=Galerina marginata (strain CBS 339.88) TaxID=685588 RepID=A0A067SLX7_GALM3|nr:hypothetical protein GALMADRAFT_256546 [Galerina marginata CBS 339.88]
MTSFVYLQDVDLESETSSQEEDLEASDSEGNETRTVLDLYDIALLLNYERASTEPRFRHAKRREVATESHFQTILMTPETAPEWYEATGPRTGMVFERTQAPRGNKDQPDLPSNMLPSPVPPALQHLTPKQIETYYWQARNHDGCFTTVALFQHFMDLFDDTTCVQVRTVDNGEPRIYTTPAIDRTIVEMKLFGPRSMNMSVILPKGTAYISASDPVISHAVLAFPSPDQDPCILDLSSLQFGDVGRGNKGRSLFVLEPMGPYLTRLDRIAEGNTFNEARLSARIRGTPNVTWLREVAAKVKERWDNRATAHWCGHCGGPPPSGQDLRRCGTCKVAYYCNSEHQKAAWGYHKHFCVTP